MRGLIAALALVAVAASAQSHLKPETSVFGGGEVSPDYYRMVADVFHEGYGDKVKLRAIFISSFSPESTVFLVKDGAAARIVTLEPKIQLWSYEVLTMMRSEQVKTLEGGQAVRADKEIADFQASLPKDYHDVKLARCEIAVDVGFADRLIAAWTPVLLETRFRQPDEEDMVMTDGTRAHFAVMTDYPPLAGQTDWADKGTKPYALWNLAVAMHDTCDSKDRAKLDAALAALERTEKRP